MADGENENAELPPPEAGKSIIGERVEGLISLIVDEGTILRMVQTTRKSLFTNDDEKEGEEDEIDENRYERLDKMDEYSEEQQLMYREYFDLTNQIDCQNELINDMKDRIRDLQLEPCLTRKELQECMRLQICIGQENIKLDTMMNRIMQLQNNGPARLYEDIELAISGPEESNFCSRCCANRELYKLLYPNQQ